MRIEAGEVEEVATALLLNAGTPPAHARLQANNLIYAELSGHPSHGLQRLPRLLDRIAKGLAQPHARGTFDWSRPTELRIDGQQGLGPVIAFAAIEALLDRVADYGIAYAAISNSNHLGMMAFYVDAVARAGKICIALSSSEALVHPFGGTRAMLGTNPVAIGIPTAEEPFVLDLATSVVSMGKVHDHALRGAALQSGWALDANGHPTTDAERAKLGSIAPFGDAKGYGLGLAFELLVAGLTGSAFAPEVHGTLDAQHVASKGDVFVIIDPPHAGMQTKRISDYLTALRHSPPADVRRPVSVPGDGARQRRQVARERGVDINDTLWTTLRARLGKPTSYSPVNQELSS